MESLSWSLGQEAAARRCALVGDGRLRGSLRFRDPRERGGSVRTFFMLGLSVLARAVLLVPSWSCTHNTNDGAVFLDIVGASLANKGRRKQKGKEAQKEEAEAPVGASPGGSHCNLGSGSSRARGEWLTKDVGVKGKKKDEKNEKEAKREEGMTLLPLDSWTESCPVWRTGNGEVCTRRGQGAKGKEKKKVLIENPKIFLYKSNLEL